MYAEETQKEINALNVNGIEVVNYEGVTGNQFPAGVTYGESTNTLSLNNSEYSMEI